VMFHQFHFLKVTLEVESDHSSLSSHVYSSWHGYLGGYGRRVLQSGIRAWFTPQTGWTVCVGPACMSVACVNLTLGFHVVVSYIMLIMVVMRT